MSSEQQSEEDLTQDLEPPSKRPRSSREILGYFEVVSRSRKANVAHISLHGHLRPHVSSDVVVRWCDVVDCTKHTAHGTAHSTLIPLCQ